MVITLVSLCGLPVTRWTPCQPHTTSPAAEIEITFYRRDIVILSHFCDAESYSM
jgi:hypothetical protein